MNPIANHIGRHPQENGLAFAIQNEEAVFCPWAKFLTRTSESSEKAISRAFSVSQVGWLLENGDTQAIVGGFWLDHNGLIGNLAVIAQGLHLLAKFTACWDWEASLAEDFFGDGLVGHGQRNHIIVLGGHVAIFNELDMGTMPDFEKLIVFIQDFQVEPHLMASKRIIWVDSSMFS